jgi:hypothetical protein
MNSQINRKRSHQSSNDLNINGTGSEKCIIKRPHTEGVPDINQSPSKKNPFSIIFFFSNLKF